jgi:diguanylate cyclase
VALLMEDRTSRRLYRARCTVAALTALLLIGALGTYGTHHVDRMFSDLGEGAVALLAAVNCALAARAASGRLRLAWAGLAGATLSWAIGEAIWSWYELVLHVATPFPGLSDVGFLGFPIGAVIALAVFPSNVSHTHRWRMTLDGLTTACAIGLVSWATALGAVFHAGGDSLLAVSVSVAYPISDIGLLVVCVLVLSRSRAHRVPLAFIAAGLVAMAVADSGFAYLVAGNSSVTGDLIDLGWFFAFGVLAFASLTRGATVAGSSDSSFTVAGTVLPYVPLTGAIAFLGSGLRTWRHFSCGVRGGF